MTNQENKDSNLDKRKLTAIGNELLSLREYLEENANSSVPLVAFSTDGRTFGYQAPLKLSIPVGG
jgi:hypothetical protein